MLPKRAFAGCDSKACSTHLLFIDETYNQHQYGSAKGAATQWGATAYRKGPGQIQTAADRR